MQGPRVPPQREIFCLSGNRCKSFEIFVYVKYPVSEKEMFRIQAFSDMEYVHLLVLNIPNLQQLKCEMQHVLKKFWIRSV